MNIDTISAQMRCLAAPLSRRAALAGVMLLGAGSLTSGVAGTEAKYQNKHHNHHQHRNHKRHERHKRHKRPIDQAPEAPPTSPPTTPPAPAPETRPDAACDASIEFGAGDPSGTFRFAQTFIPLASGALVSAELRIVKRPGSAGDYVLRLSPVDDAGIPLDTVLEETTVLDSTVPEGSNRILFTFANPISVVAGATYALVLNRPGGNMEWAAHAGDGDCAGHSFTSQGQTAPFQGGGFDFIYTTFVSS